MKDVKSVPMTFTGTSFNSTGSYESKGTVTTCNNVISMPYSGISSISLQNSPYIKDILAHHNEIEELREMISKLMAKPYFMKIQCHNCGASLEIESSNHLVKCKYCHTAYFSGTQLINSF